MEAPNFSMLYFPIPKAGMPLLPCGSKYDPGGRTFRPYGNKRDMHTQDRKTQSVEDLFVLAEMFILEGGTTLGRQL